MNIVIYIEENVAAQDFAVPYELLYGSRDCAVQVVARRAGRVKTLSGLIVEVPYGIDQIEQADVLWVCGAANREIALDDHLKRWVVKLAAGASYTVGTGTGALILALTGLLDNCQCTFAQRYLKKFKKSSLQYVAKPIVEDGNIFTAALSAQTLALTLRLMERLYDRDYLEPLMQRYHFGQTPAPQYHADTLDKAVQKQWLKLEKSYKKALDNYVKGFKKQASSKAERCVYYMFDGMRAIDLIAADQLISHLPYQRSFIADQKGAVDIAGGGFKVHAEDAIQNHRQAHLLVIPGGTRIRAKMESSYVTHWLTSICQNSYRVLTVAEGEQLIGITGVLKNVDLAVLDSLALGEGKYVMTHSFFEAGEALKKIARDDFKFDVTSYQHYFGYGDCDVFTLARP